MPETIEERVARLDQRVSDIGRQVEALTPLAVQAAKQGVTLANLSSDVGEVRQATAAIKTTLDNDREKYAEQRDDDVRQAKTDRRWLIGTILASSTFIVGAVGVIVSAVS